METMEDFKRGDAWETEHQHNKADALDECMILAGSHTSSWIF